VLPFTRGWPDRRKTRDRCGRYRLSSLVAFFFVSAESSSRALLSKRVVERNREAKTLAKRQQTKRPKPKNAQCWKWLAPTVAPFRVCQQVPLATHRRPRCPKVLRASKSATNTPRPTTDDETYATDPQGNPKNTDGWS